MHGPDGWAEIGGRQERGAVTSRAGSSGRAGRRGKPKPEKRKQIGGHRRQGSQQQPRRTAAPKGPKPQTHPSAQPTGPAPNFRPFVPLVPLVRATIFRADYDKRRGEGQQKPGGRCTAADARGPVRERRLQAGAAATAAPAAAKAQAVTANKHRGGRDTAEPRSRLRRGLR